MFLGSRIWLHNQIHVVISESAETHERAISELKAQGGVCLSESMSAKYPRLCNCKRQAVCMAFDEVGRS